MREYALILISTVFVNNFVLVKFLGLCPFMGVSRKYGASFGMGLATTLVLMVTSALTYLTETYILAPLDLTYLRTIAYIFVIALVVQTLEIVLKKTNPELYGVLGIYLPARRYVVGAWDKEFKYVRADGDEVKLITARLDGRYAL